MGGGKERIKVNERARRHLQVSERNHEFQTRALVRRKRERDNDNE